MQKQAWICTSLVSALWFICTTSQTNKCTAKVQPLQKVSLSLRMQRELFLGAFVELVSPTGTLKLNGVTTVPLNLYMSRQHWKLHNGPLHASEQLFPSEAEWLCNIGHSIVSPCFLKCSDVRNPARLQKAIQWNSKSCHFLLRCANTEATSSPKVGRVMCIDHQPVSARAFQN